MTSAKLIILPALFVLALAGCTTTDNQNAVIGGATGAVIGGVATGSLQGAAVGTAVGAGAGILLGKVLNSPGYCRYRNSRGRLYIAQCR
jgi:hypothetical protein